VNNRCVVGIMGYKGSGKDEVGKILRHFHGFETYAFASPMKEACKTIFLWGDAEVYGSRKEIVDPRWGISPRQALQLLGTEFGQLMLCEASPQFKETTGRKLWVNRFKELLEQQPFKQRWVITDVRFPHEVDVIRELGGTILKVDRPDIAMTDPHESEKWCKIIKEDYTIVNDSTLEELQDKVYIFASEYLSL